MEISELFYIGIAVFTGLIFGKLVKLIKLPNVTGYLIGGLIIGPSVLGKLGINIIPENAIEELGYFSDIALGFIAFTIGTNFQFDYFKRVGVKPIVIAIFESLFAVVFVFVALVIAGQNIEFSLLIAAIASATAPAATIMVIKQYKAKGETTETLMSVVALDDAVALILFGFAVAISNAISSQESSVVWGIIKPFIEVIASLSIGMIMGVILSFLLKWFTGRSNRIACIFSIILITASAPSLIGLVLPDFEISSLLSCMMIGAVFCNMTPKYNINPIMELVDRFTPPILIMFFVMSGADLNLSILASIGLVGLIYVIFRVIGKMFGAWLGALITKCSTNVRNYLGLALVPQAGVAIGLTVVAGNCVPQYAAQIRAIILCATLIYELVGPAISKFALTKAGDIKKEQKA